MVTESCLSQHGTVALDEVALLRAEEVARVLGLSRSKIYQMMGLGALPIIRVGRAVRVPRQALLDWIAQHTTEAA